jgi:Amidohydrolase family
MVHHGLTAGQALTAATQTAAQALDLDEHVGTVEPGKLADLLIVDGDPLADPAVLAGRDRIWLVLQLGVPVAGQALEHDLAGVALSALGTGLPDRGAPREAVPALSSPATPSHNPRVVGHLGALQRAFMSNHTCADGAPGPPATWMYQKGRSSDPSGTSTPIVLSPEAVVRGGPLGAAVPGYRADV